MDRRINLNTSVHDLCKQYPELIEILNELGFKDITKPGMLNTAGRFMTLPKGAAMKKIDISDIENALIKHGFTIDK